VLNIAILMLGERLNEPAYSDFARKNIAFTLTAINTLKRSIKMKTNGIILFGQDD